LLLTGSSKAQTTQIAKPNTAVAADTCVSAGCHADVKNYKVVHGPVNVNGCAACHKLVDEKEHKFELARNKTETCTFCHKLDIATDPVVHKPVAEGQCLQCHNPHGGQTAKFLRGKTMNELCSKCHNDVVANKSHIHGPIAAGACDSCHKSHSSDHKKLLIAEGRDLCFSCHTEMKTKMETVKVKHKAVEQDCTTCHDPHASNFAMQTKQAPLQLCTSCHEHDKIKQAAMNSAHKHPPVTNDQACLNCHTAHGGDLAKLMKTTQVKVCMGCHKEKIDRGKGVPPVNAVAEVLDPKQFKHGPAADGLCGGCHNVHGSDVDKLLMKPFPSAFYQSFSIEKYDLCFSCHNKELVLNEKTTGLTNFRNGDRNLHFVHVNKQEKGRSCRACHAIHASANPLHIRDSVPFGAWNMPIKYQQAKTGGACTPGCHKSYTYDRQNPVNYDQPTPAPAPEVNPATSQPTVAADLKEKLP